MNKWLSSIAKKPRRALKALIASNPRTLSPPLDEAAERVRKARTYFSNGRAPTTFSINLGVAPCNHSCLFCPQSVHKPRKAGWLDMDVLRKVVSEMPETGMTVHISSYSETLAAPNLLTAVRILKEIRPKLTICMATNGSLFREEVVRGLMEAGLDQYSYSFDAPDRDGYKRLMQVDHFDRVWNNLERILEIRNELGARTLITTHIMGFEEFKDKYAEFEKYWAPKLDHVYLREVKNWGGDTWGLEAQLEKNGFSIPKSSIPAKRFPCNSIFQHFKLQYDGRYAPCVAAVPDYAPEEELHNVPYIGYAKDMTFVDAWEKLDNMRRAHLAGEWDRYECCRSCSIWSAWPDVWDDKGEGAGPKRFEIPDVDHASK